MAPAFRAYTHADRADLHAHFTRYAHAVRAIASADDRARRSAAAYADEWCPSWPHAPTTSAEALDPHGPWSAAACGIEVRDCVEDRSKGKGAFATKDIPIHSLIGVYWGERLTQRQLDVRHGTEGRPGSAVADCDLTALEQTLRRCRGARLRSASDPPMRGEDNHGAYFFHMAPDGDAEDCSVVGIDGEDPARSTWCRYINNEAPGRANVRARIDARRHLVWFESKREIACGEELSFTYTGMPAWLYRWRFGMPITRVAIKLVPAVLGWLALAFASMRFAEVGSVVVYGITPAAACYLLWTGR